MRHGACKKAFFGRIKLAEFLQSLKIRQWLQKALALINKPFLTKSGLSISHPSKTKANRLLKCRRELLRVGQSELPVFQGSVFFSGLPKKQALFLFIELGDLEKCLLEFVLKQTFHLLETIKYKRKRWRTKLIGKRLIRDLKPQHFIKNKYQKNEWVQMNEIEWI